jgi:hypothetical protein
MQIGNVFSILGRENMSTEKKYWFPAKSYGWGWGVPSCWQGWVVLVGYFILMAIGVLIVPPGPHPVLFMLYTMILSALLIIVCWLKGEPPGWRWGK